MNQLKSWVTKPPEVAGLEIIVLPDNQFRLTLCVLGIKKGIVSVREKVAEVTDPTELKPYLSAQIPVVLVIHGKSILHKRILLENDQTVSTAELLKANIPNLNTEEFCVQDYRFTGGAFLSLLRLESLNKLLDQLQEAGIWIVSATVGPFIITQLLGFLPIPNEEAELSFQSHQLSLRAGEIVNLRTTGEVVEASSFQIGTELLEGKWLFSYAAAMSQLLGSFPVSLPAERLSTNRNEWEQSRIFRFAGWGFLLFLLASLLVNFLLYTHFNQQNIALLSSTDKGDKSTERIEKLRATLKERSFFFKTAGWLHPTRNSFYADRLASTVPDQIALLELAINPLEERQSKMEKRLVFIPDVLQVKGRCADPQILNAWLKQINQLDWVKEIGKQNYAYDNRKQAGFFDFQIVLKKTPHD